MTAPEQPQEVETTPKIGVDPTQVPARINNPADAQAPVVADRDVAAEPAN